MDDLRWRIKLVKARMLAASLLVATEKHFLATLDFLFQGMNTMFDLVEALEVVSVRSDGRDDSGTYIWRHLELHLAELNSLLIKHGWEAHHRSVATLNEQQEVDRIQERYYTHAGYELTVRFGNYGFIACLRNTQGSEPATSWYYKEGQMLFALKRRGLWKDAKEAA